MAGGGGGRERPFWYGLVNLRRITPEGSIAIVQGASPRVDNY